MTEKNTEKHTIVCLVENHFGVLARVSGLISARGFNIESLTVSKTEDETLSRMTIVVEGDAATLEQVKRQLNRLVDVVEIWELRAGEFIDRELLLARVKADDKKREDLKNVAAKFGAKISDGDDSVIVEATGNRSSLDGLLEELRPFGITKLARTGRVALERA